MFFIFLLALAVAAESITSFDLQITNSSSLITQTVSSPGPTGTSSSGCGVPAQQGDYTGDLRPQIHFSPPKNFMNDPNGCYLDAEGTWHLYYQYNPDNLTAGHQNWGHATSTDLYTWQNQPIALCPDNSTLEQIFSGSIVIDVNNTSGLFPDQTDGVVAIYTLNTAAKQTQEIAYSFDKGYTFTPYSGNPVIDSDSTQFRDPKVIWYQGNHWVMVVAYSQDYQIGFFTSYNLIDWTPTSNFSHQGLLGHQYECPNLIELPLALTGNPGTNTTMWTLTISINPGSPQGGSTMQYFPGFFNGTHFWAVDGAARIADFGKDNYAGQFFYGVDPTVDPVMIGWASNWQYCEDVPTATEGWRSTMTLPRHTRLVNLTRLGFDLVSYPYDTSGIQGSAVTPVPPLSSTTLTDNVPIVYDYKSVASGALMFNLSFPVPTNGSAAGRVTFNFSASATGESLTGGYIFSEQKGFWLDRGGLAGFKNEFFTDKISANVLPELSGALTIEGYIDRTIFEVFLQNRSYSSTTTFYPTARLDTLTFTGANLSFTPQPLTLSVTGLKGTWPAAAAASSSASLSGAI